MKEKIFNVVVVGVGGQGILLTSDILAQVAFKEGYDVKKSEVHGMAQRGGSVISEVRFGRRVYSPLVRKGGADFMVALEKLEALRFLYYLKKDAPLIVNDLEIPPLGVNLGKEKYPEDIFLLLTRRTSRVIKVDALNMAKEAGNPKAMNVAVLGILSFFLPFAISSWKKVIREKVPSYSVDFNLRAFDLGRSYGEKYVSFTQPKKVIDKAF